MEKNIFSNLSTDNEDHESRDIRRLFAITFSLYNFSENYNVLYKKDADCTIAKELISLYYKRIKPNYSNMIYSFKKKYIINEALVEKNDTQEQKRGLKAVYDYIQNYSKDAEEFNILIESLRISELLWKPTDQKHLEDLDAEKDECFAMIQEAKEEKNMEKYKQAKAKLRELSTITADNKIGGRIRQDSDEVDLLGYEILVPSGVEARIFINSFSSPEKRKEFLEHLKNDNEIDYIEYCVKICADLIKYQPFKDGNKRTFRSLLNLMFKEKNLPPVYIRPKEREEYHKVLFEAIQNGNYDNLVKFYNFKICDSIYELDVAPYIIRKVFNQTPEIKENNKEKKLKLNDENSSKK
ncbi:MAG: Fic family protein [Bacilli bacterium]|nr:Fic family protein [Bacilli bacterium]